MQLKWRGGMFVVAAMSATLVCSLHLPSVRADDASERASLMTAIDQELADIASSLGELPRASSEVPGTHALEVADVVANNVSKLSDVKGDDSDADHIVNYYPGYLGQFRRATTGLIAMKKVAGKPAMAKAACDQQQRDLQYQVQPYLDRDDPDGLAQIPSYADTAARTAESTWSALAYDRQSFDAGRGETSYLSASDGRWSDVRNALTASAATLGASWSTDFDAANKACADLRAGTKSPFVLKALEQLANKAATRGQVVKDGEARIDAANQSLSNADRDSDASRIANAIATITALSRELSALQSARTTDAKTTRILETWPRYITDFNAAAANLTQLKAWQFTLDNAPARCSDQQRALDSILASYEDASSVPAVEAKGAEIQADMRTRLDGAAAKDREMDSWVREANRFQVSDGNWSTLSRTLRDTADAEFSHWRRSLDDAHRACDALALGVGNPSIVSALTRLNNTIPPSARHQGEHDSNCIGVTAGGFCTADDQCLDGSCRNHVCETCPSGADGRCHPPGLCRKNDYDTMVRVKDDACSKPYASASYKPQKGFACADLDKLCHQGSLCSIARFDIMDDCFRGGDTRHKRVYDEVRKVVKECESLLYEKRRSGDCTQ